MRTQNKRSLTELFCPVAAVCLLLTNLHNKSWLLHVTLDHCNTQDSKSKFIGEDSRQN